ncbi:MAG: TonB-dependent siderophore receptor [Kiloniellaceae bacterium]
MLCLQAAELQAAETGLRDVSVRAALAQAQQRFDFAIEAKPLPQAIAEFSAVTGIQVLYTEPATFQFTAPALNGTFTADEALRQLLAGSGLLARYTSDNAVTIERLAQESEGTMLDPITVVGRSETATGPVEGFVATRSASGTKTDTPIIETPQSLSVVTADEIEETKAATMAEALGYNAFVSSQPSGFSRVADDFTIRGFNVANGNLGMLRDGLKFQSNVYDGGQEVYGLERLEVLRGPSSVLYGQLGPGGAINAVTKQPTLDPLHEVNLEYGTYDHMQISTDHGGALDADGQFSYRLTGLYRESDTWVDYVQDDKAYVAPAFTWRPDDDTSLTLLASFQRIDTKFDAPLPAAGTLFPGAGGSEFDRDVFLGEPDFDRYEADTYTAGYKLEHDFLPNLKLRHASRYFRSHVDWNYMQVIDFFGPDLLGRRASQREERSYGITSDTSLQLDFDTGEDVAHTLLGGVDFYRSSYDNDRFYDAGSFFDTSDPVYGLDPDVNYAVNRGFDTDINQFGLYLQDQVKVDDHWVLLVGGRYDWFDTNTLSYQTDAKQKMSGGDFSGRLGLVYLADNGLAPYVSYSESFSPESGADADGNAFVPSTGKQVEAGIRYQPPGSNTMLSAAVYHLTRQNVVSTDPATFDQYQIGEVRSRGLELEARTEFDDLRLIATYALTDTRITESLDTEEEGQRQDGVPLHAFTLWGDYGLDSLGIPGLRIGAGARYTGTSNIIGIDQDNDDYVLFDASLTYELGELFPAIEGAEFQINARNLLDKDYVNCISEFGCRFGDPLTVVGTLRYRW